jgi:hypothetical protein
VGGRTPRAEATTRRHKPRAPSSGARFHQHHHAGAPLTSPRKPRRDRVPSLSSAASSPSPPEQQQQQMSASRHASGGGRRPRRATSLQAIPRSGSGLGSHHHAEGGGGGEAPGGEIVDLGATAGGSIRKRSSSSRRRATPSSHHYRSRDASAELMLPPPAATAEGATIGFVNCTPDDHSALMAGVAPSGSSKTKARREREAAERQRRLNEAFLKAVAAAGGDLRKLEEEGIVL